MAKTRWPLQFKIRTQFPSGLSPFENQTGPVYEWSLCAHVFGCPVIGHSMYIQSNLDNRTSSVIEIAIQSVYRIIPDIEVIKQDGRQTASL